MASFCKGEATRGTELQFRTMPAKAAGCLHASRPTADCKQRFNESGVSLVCMLPTVA